MKNTLEWYLSHLDWWGDVSGALVPHCKMLAMFGVQRRVEGQFGAGNQNKCKELADGGLSKPRTENNVGCGFPYEGVLI